MLSVVGILTGGREEGHGHGGGDLQTEEAPGREDRAIAGIGVQLRTGMWRALMGFVTSACIYWFGMFVACGFDKVPFLSNPPYLFLYFSTCVWFGPINTPQVRSDSCWGLFFYAAFDPAKWYPSFQALGFSIFLIVVPTACLWKTFLEERGLKSGVFFFFGRKSGVLAAIDCFEFWP